MAGDSSIPSISSVTASVPVAGIAPLVTPADDHLPVLPALAASPLPTNGGVKTELSIAARLLAALADPALARETPTSPPLLSAAEAKASVIAQAVRDGIAHSGLFYESHQADWVAGARDIESLKQEPQARPPSQSDSDDRTVPLIVRQQLDLIDGQALQWRGELWPGLPLQLSISKDEQQPTPSPADQSDTEPAWQTMLVSTLPALGRISARLRIEGERLWLDIASGEAGSVALMARHAGELRSALQEGGLRLQSFGSRIDAES